MRAIRLTKQEVLVIDTCVVDIEVRRILGRQVKHLDSIASKICEANVAVKYPDGSTLEAALIDSSNGKVIGLEGHVSYARASRQAGLLGLTNADAPKMAIMGQWLSSQSWITSSLTLLDVLAKWATWYPKAQHEITRQGSNSTGSTSPSRRPASGFR